MKKSAFFILFNFIRGFSSSYCEELETDNLRVDQLLYVWNDFLCIIARLNSEKLISWSRFNLGKLCTNCINKSASPSESTNVSDSSSFKPTIASTTSESIPYTRSSNFLLEIFLIEWRHVGTEFKQWRLRPHIKLLYINHRFIKLILNCFQNFYRTWYVLELHKPERYIFLFTIANIIDLTELLEVRSNTCPTKVMWFSITVPL